MKFKPSNLTDFDQIKIILAFPALVLSHGSNSRMLCCVCPCEPCVPEGGHAVAGGPAHDEAPLWVGASLAHFLYTAGCPHLTHSDLGLHLEMSGGPTEETVCFIKLDKGSS